MGNARLWLHNTESKTIDPMSNLAVKCKYILCEKLVSAYTNVLWNAIVIATRQPRASSVPNNFGDELKGYRVPSGDYQNRLW
jgi:hypothetical protein